MADISNDSIVNGIDEARSAMHWADVNYHRAYEDLRLAKTTQAERERKDGKMGMAEERVPCHDRCLLASHEARVHRVREQGGLRDGCRTRSVMCRS